MKRAASLALALTFVASAAYAWEPISPARPTWSGPVPYSLNQRGSADLGGFSGTEPEVRQGMDDWTRVSCTSLTTDYRGSTSAVPGNYEGVSTIGWIESGWPHTGSAIGVTGPRWGRDTIIEADMAMNGVNFSWTTGSGRFDNVNAYSIVLHEGGHYYGLGHSDVRGSSMWPSYSGGIIGLGPDDENGICALYPGGSSDCTMTGCPSGQECVSGSCQPIMGDGSMCAPCRDSSECGGGGLCLGYPNGAGYCGTPCSSSADCGSGDMCYSTRAGGQCVRFDGSVPSCDVTPSGCRNDSECGADELCSGGECVPRPATGNELGESCTSDDDCRSALCLGGVCTQSCAWLDSGSCPAGFYCDGGSTTSCTNGYCLAGSAGAGELGDACSADTDCASLFCDGGTCTTQCVPGGAVGCEDGYTCQVGTLSCRGACRRGRELGDACETNEDCFSGACAMQGGDSFCTQTCDDASPCPNGFTCTPAGDQSLCAPDLGGLDDACVTDADCLSGVCTTEHGASYCTRGCETPCPSGFVCGMTETDEAVCVREERGVGQDCDASEDCASRMCAEAGDDTFCTQVCSDMMPCPSGSECVEAGEVELCRPIAMEPVSRGGCGCVVARERGFATPLTRAAPLLLGLLALLWRRRRAARR